MLLEGYRSPAGNKELIQVRQEFMLTAMRTCLCCTCRTDCTDPALVLLKRYLQAVKDRRPAVLENKEPMPRARVLAIHEQHACLAKSAVPQAVVSNAYSAPEAKILEFFDVCNTRTLLCITSVRPNGVVEPDTAFKVGRMDLPETHKARGMDRC